MALTLQNATKLKQAGLLIFDFALALLLFASFPLTCLAIFLLALVKIFSGQKGRQQARQLGLNPINWVIEYPWLLVAVAFEAAVFIAFSIGVSMPHLLSLYIALMPAVIMINWIGLAALGLAVIVGLAYWLLKPKQYTPAEIAAINQASLEYGLQQSGDQVLVNDLKHIFGTQPPYFDSGSASDEQKGAGPAVGRSNGAQSDFKPFTGTGYTLGTDAAAPNVVRSSSPPVSSASLYPALSITSTSPSAPTAEVVGLGEWQPYNSTLWNNAGADSKQQQQTGLRETKLVSQTTNPANATGTFETKPMHPTISATQPVGVQPPQETAEQGRKRDRIERLDKLAAKLIQARAKSLV